MREPLKTRVQPWLGMVGKVVAQSYVVQVLHNGRWTPIGDKGEVTKHKTRAEAQKARQLFLSKVIKVTKHEQSIGQTKT